MEMREAIKELWRCCFDDTETFIELYFRTRYQEDRNLALHKGKELIAAMQLIPYPMNYCNKEISTAYISGACTHPEHRKQGAMSLLLTQAFKKMRQEGVVFSTLIPANEPLFSYYARHGFSPVFHEVLSTYNAPETTSPLNTLQFSQDCEHNLIFRYFDRHQRQTPYCILHTYQDFQIIAADIHLSGGNIFTLKSKEKIHALAFVSPNNGEWKVKACMADTQELKQVLFYHICKILNIQKITIQSPYIGIAPEQRHALGMARIIHAHSALQHYASANPSLSLNLYLTDPQLPENNGIYHIEHGHCIKNAKQSSNDCPAFTISELTEKIFSGLHPSMSLMLND